MLRSAARGGRTQAVRRVVCLTGMAEQHSEGMMKARLIAFGLVELDGQTYDYDVLVERGRISRRRKKASKPQRDQYGHTPLTTLEPLPWRCRQLIIGTGAEGRLPVTPEVIEEARRRGVELITLPTAEACARLSAADVDKTAAVLHVTC